MKNYPKTREQKVALRLQGSSELCLDCTHFFVMEEPYQRVCNWLGTRQDYDNSIPRKGICIGFAEFELESGP